MKILFIFLAVAILAAAAPPEKKPGGKGGGTHQKPLTDAVTLNLNLKSNDTDNADNADNFNDNNRDYCYDSSWSFKCRQQSPTDYELECKIHNVDGAPCFPDLIKMIESSTPLSTISYPIPTWQAQKAVDDVDLCVPIITTDNIESISLQAPFERIPADAFCGLPALKKITLESLDGVKAMLLDKHAFRNSSAKHLHFVGHDVRSIMEQDIDFHQFSTVTFSDVEIECHHHNSHEDENNVEWDPWKNVTCDHLFEGLKSIENLNLESIYVKGEKLDEHVFKPVWDTLKKLTFDVVFKGPPRKEGLHEEKPEGQWENHENTTCDLTKGYRRGFLPVETFAFMSKLEEMELYLYEPIIGLRIHNDTPVPLPVSKSLERLVVSCRYCRYIALFELGKWLPNLRQLTMAAPIQPSVITDHDLKLFSKLEHLTIYDKNLRSIERGAFKSAPSLKQLAIKFAEMPQWHHEHWNDLADTLELLTITGTPIKEINVSKLVHLTSLDISQNRLTKMERNMLPEKAVFSELNFSYNPIKKIDLGFLKGVELKNHAMHMNGLEMESLDVSAFEGMENLWTIDVTQNLKMKDLDCSDCNKLPKDLKSIIVGRSPMLTLKDEQGHLEKMLIEKNITMVVEGSIGCCCGMKWMNDMLHDHPQLLELTRSRAICSRQGTDVKMPDSFWTHASVTNFLKMIGDEQLGLCRDQKKP